MGLQFLIFFFKPNVINPRGLVDDIMTMECPEGLERGKNVGKKKRTRSPVETFTLLVYVKKKTFQQKIHLVILWVPGAHGNCNPVNLLKKIDESDLFLPTTESAYKTDNSNLFLKLAKI